MFDIGIIGAGPAGYSAAIRAAQKGLSVILFEKEFIGGTCLNKGCIPTKTILHSCKLYSEMKNAEKFGINAENITFDFEKIQQRQKMISEKIRKSLTNLIKSYGIVIVEDTADIENEHVIKTSDERYEVKNIIIATGSKPNKIKFKGNYGENFLLTSDDILNITKLPQSILIVGSGAIGLEWARILSTLNVKVTIVEMMDKIIPNADFEVSDRAVRLLKKNRIDFYTSTTIEEIQNKTITLSNGKTVEADNILVAAGRKPLEDLSIFSKELKLQIKENFKTNKDNIYIIGDVNRESMLAHSAAKQAEEVIEHILNGTKVTFNKNLVPSIIYGTPEIAQIGKTEQELQKENTDYKKSFFPISALGKAYAEDKIEGFIKILATDKEILGAHIISEEASAMIAQIAIAMTNKLSPKDIQKVIFAHPTYSEGILESFLALDNLAINIPQNK